MGDPDERCSLASVLRRGALRPEQFFELDLAAILGYPDDGQGVLGAEDWRHWLKVFWLVFRRDAFLPGAVDERTFHERARGRAFSSGAGRR